MTKVASYLSKKIGRSIHLIDIGGVKPIQQSWGGGNLFDAGGQLTSQRIQPESQEPALGLVASSRGTQTLQIEPHD